MIEAELKTARDRLAELKAGIKLQMVGYDEVIDQLIIGLLAGGHILLEGVPGIGKTLLVKALSQALGLNFARIQFTPDLMPADITGTNIIVEDADGRRGFQFQPGPVFNNIILADEINRATPKTQSALLEAMQELTVTAGGIKHRIETPFTVVATQNPIEMEGTYPLPEAQLDRFLFKLVMPQPGLPELKEIINRTTTEKQVTVSPLINREQIIKYQSLIRQIPVAANLVEYVSKLVLASQPDTEYATGLVRKYVRYGAGPRAAQAVILAAKVSALMQGRLHVAQDDVLKMILPVLRHRIIMNIEGESSNISITGIIEEIRTRTPALPPGAEKILSLSE
ncbi:MAG: MoxR family ATPase [Planctomycetes bacterium]|nr:MoxR family ATPase [Planctomycetota bacterium]